jgi:Flp pilus assembly protein TadB
MVEFFDKIEFEDIPSEVVPPKPKIKKKKRKKPAKKELLVTQFLRKYKESIKREIIYADVRLKFNEFLIISLFLGIIFAELGYLLLPIIFHFLVPDVNFSDGVFQVLSIIMFFIGCTLLKAMLSYSANKKAREVDQALPEFLEFIASNLGVGMTLYSALRLTSSSELSYGPIPGQLRESMQVAVSNKPFREVLEGLAYKIKSKKLERVIEILVTVAETGGNIGILLDELAGHLRDIETLKKELNAGATSYIFMIAGTSCFAAPLLFAIGANLLQSFNNMPQQLQAETLGEEGPGGITAEISGGLGANLMKGTAIKPSTFSLIAYTLIIVNAICAGMMFGSIREGRRLVGLKYTPVFATIAIILFSVFKWIFGLLIALGGG